MPNLATPAERSERSRRAQRLAIRRAKVFTSWLAAERSRGREPSVLERVAERAMIREVVR